MPRPKKLDRDLPACVYRKHGAIWLVKRGKWTRLGDTVSEALAAYSKAITRPSDGVAGLLHRWFDDAKDGIAEATRKSYAGYVEKLAKVFTEFEPHEITARDVLAMMHHLRKQPGTANAMRNVLINALEFAFMEGLVERNVARDTRPFTIKARDRYLSDPEFSAIQAKASPTMAAMMDILYLTGQRISDVMAIRYSDIGDDGIVFRQQKTKHRMIVAWSPELLAAVDTAKALHQSVKGLTLFHTRQGKPFSKATIRTWWDRAREAAGIEDARIHDIRAKAGTDAKKEGLDSMALLGHKSESSHNRYLRSKDTPIAKPVTPRKRSSS